MMLSRRASFVFWAGPSLRSGHALSRDGLVARPSPAWPAAAGLGPSGGDHSRGRARHRASYHPTVATSGWRSSKLAHASEGVRSMGPCRTGISISVYSTGPVLLSGVRLEGCAMMGVRKARRPICLHLLDKRCRDRHGLTAPLVLG